MVFGIGYSDDLFKVEVVLIDIVKLYFVVLKIFELNIKVYMFNILLIDFIVCFWVKIDDYWDVYWDVIKEVKLCFDWEGIFIFFL